MSIKELENQIAKINSEIFELDKQATIAYKAHSLDEENKWQKRIDKKVVERGKIRTELFKAYTIQERMTDGVLEKYENSNLSFAVLGKIAWVNQPLIRQITVERLDDKKFIYIKLDATDGFSGNVQQGKFFLDPRIAEEMKDGIEKTLKELENEKTHS